MEIKVCVGTYCHLMGATEIYEYLEKYLKDNPDSFKLSASSCLEYCNNSGYAAPIILIGSKLYSGITVDKLKNLLDDYGL